MIPTVSVTDSAVRRNDRLIAILTALVAAVVYIITLAPTVSFWDSGEYITCAWTSGIPHPPGVPLFVLLGRVSTILFFFIPSIAARINLMCALSGAASIGILTLLVQRWGSRMGFQPCWYRPMSVLSGLIAAFSYSVWRNNNGAETYATALLLIFIILWAFDSWMDRYGRKELPAGTPGAGGWGEAKYLLLISYLVILAIGNHGSVPFITGPVMFLLYFAFTSGRWKTAIWRRSWFIMTLLGLALLAFSVHLYMPIRAVQSPEINETDPSVWSSFEKALSREQYGHTSIWDRKGPFHEQMGLYMEYLSWQSGRVQDGWDRALGDGGGAAASMVMKVVLIFGALYGLAALAMKQPRILLLITLLFLMSSVLFIFFALNFKTGQEGTTLGEVRERDYFFGASFAFFAMLSGIGLVSVVKDFLAKRSRFAWLLLIIPGISLGINYFQCDRSNSYFARDYGINLLESCPEGAVLITNGDNDTFPLWFAQGVLGVRRDVIVSNLSLMNTNWYVDQLLDRDPLLMNYRDLDMVDSLRPVFVWGPHHFHVTDDGMPGNSPMDGEILRASFDQAWPWAITVDRMAISLPVETEANQGALSMQDLVLLEMVARRPIHGREIYFAGTVARDSRIFLENYQEMEGIAYRITDEPVVDAVNAVRGWELMNSYLYTGVDDPGVFKCDQAVQLLRNYVSGYHQLAYHYLTMGQPDSAAMALDGAERLFSTLPDEWTLILPSRSIIVARLVDGTSGAEAAMDTLLVLADQLTEAGLSLGNSDVAASGNYLASLARGTSYMLGYQQQMDYDQLFDAIDDGSIPFAWLRTELSLMFTDFVTAWVLVDGMETSPDDPLSAPLADLARSTLAEVAGESSVTTRLSIMDTGLSIVFEYMDTSDPGAFSLVEGTGAQEVLEGMYLLASRGRVMSAVSAGLVLADRMEDQDQAEMVRLCAEIMLEQGTDAVQWSRWFVTEGNRVSPEALAYMAAEAGRPDMLLAALSGTGVPDAVIQAILNDPYGYSRGVPLPGSGSGVYAWVAPLGAGGSGR